jgi:Ser/Thr protein kinase RdoA (MazF antagonist)
VPDSVNTVRVAFADSPLPKTILGTADPGEVVASLADWSVENLDSGLTAVFRCEISVGVVFGCSLTDGRRVAVKAHSPSTTPAQIETVQTAQRRLAASGYPCPMPASAAAPLCATVGAAEEWLDGPPGNFDQPAVISASARALAAHIRILGELELELPPTIAGRDWPPTPHNALFDFEREAKSAGWIDEIALRARSVLDAGAIVVGHADWSAKHVRIRGDRVVATYDWDSLVRDRKPVLVGFAAASHHVHLDPSLPWQADSERVHRYLDAYEVESSLTPSERAAAAAAAVLLYAYTARCEHGYRGPGEPVTRVRDNLAAAADALLNRA